MEKDKTNNATAQKHNTDSTRITSNRWRSKEIEEENLGINILKHREHLNKLGTLFAINQRLIDIEKESTIKNKMGRKPKAKYD